MAEAIIRGILRGGLVSAGDIVVGEPLESRRSYLARELGVATTPDDHTAAEGADLVVIAVKPQNLSPALNSLQGALRPGQVVVSIVAGVSIQDLSTALDHSAIVRVMPNTPAQIGAGMSVWTCTPQVSQDVRDFVGRMLETLGLQMFVDEEHYLDMATAVSASGPAFVFTFLQALIDAGVYGGLPRDMARTLAVQTVLGSALMARDTGRHPAELADMVTSPGGTTAEGLLALEEGAFRAVVMQAVISAYHKALRLGEEE